MSERRASKGLDLPDLDRHAKFEEEPSLDSVNLNIGALDNTADVSSEILDSPNNYQ